MPATKPWALATVTDVVVGRFGAIPGQAPPKFVRLVPPAMDAVPGNAGAVVDRNGKVQKPVAALNVAPSALSVAHCACVTTAATSRGLVLFCITQPVPATKPML